MRNDILLSDWSLGWSDTLTGAPSEIVPARVPSDVQLVWQKEKNMPDPYYGVNYREYAWMEKKFWHYRTTVAVSPDPALHTEVRFGGIDYRYTIYTDGEPAADGEGMYTPVTVNLDRFSGRKVALECVIHPVPCAEGPEGRDEARYSVKPPVPYGWDFHPRLIPSGLYEPVTLSVGPRARIAACDLSYTLPDDLSRADIVLEAACAEAEGMTLSVTLTDPDGIPALEKVFPAVSGTYAFSLEHPRLWYPVHRGRQDRYTVTVRLIREGAALDEVVKPLGFRRSRLTKNYWMEGSFPKGPLPYPATFEINGQKLFAKGTNLVPVRMFHSLMNRESYREVLEKVRDAHMNIVRLWGGGLVNKEAFFDLCDEMGIMVWQEFTLACTDYPDDPHYLAVLDRESRSVIRRLRVHPSHVLWCGGNELFNSWSGMTSQSLALRLLDKNTLELDPQTPYNMTSPLFGMAHGHYQAMSGEDRETVSDFIDNDRTAYTEFGSGGAADLEFIRGYCPPEEWERIEPGTSWEDHHALMAWNGVDNWLNRPVIEAYVGKTSSVEELLSASQLVQAVSYRALFETARQKWPNTSMALNWCMNEPWPCFANNSLLMFPAIPKPAYTAVASALRDRMISARFYRLRCRVGETVEMKLFLLNDLAETMPSGSFTVTVSDEVAEDEVIFAGAYDSVSPGSVTPAGTCSFVVKAGAPRRFTVRVDAGEPSLSSEYTLFVVE